MQAGGIRRGKVASGDDVGLRGLADAFGLRTEELVKNATGHIPDIRRPLAQEVVVHLLKDFDVPLGDLLKTKLDVEAATADLFAHVIDQGDILEDEEVRVENRSLGLVKFAGDVITQLRDLLAGGRQGGLEATNFGLGVGNLFTRDNGHTPHQWVGGTTSHSRSGGDALEANLGPMVSGLHPCVN